MKKNSGSGISVALVLLLGGCALGGHGSIRYDTTVRSAAGTIAISDPKLFSRENLINERARDVAWIDGLIAASEDPTKVVFKPALLREMEEISAFSAALGLKFDPASATNYRRANATGEVQQEIDVLRLQLQLEQLRRDAELLRAKLPVQTEPANSGLGTLAPAAASPAATEVTPADVTQLTTAVNGLMTSLAGRLDAEGRPAGRTDIASSPLEDFRDRLAYRDALRAARNSAGLDELHDLAANRLIRLNFQATVFPDPGNARSLAAVQLKVADQSKGDRGNYLVDWLRFVNTRPEYRSGPTPTLTSLADTGDFELVAYGSTSILLPVLQDVDPSPESLRLRAFWNIDATADVTRHQQRLGLISTKDRAAKAAAFAALCSVGNSSVLSSELDMADARIASYPVIKAVNAIYEDLGLTPPAAAVDPKYRQSIAFRDTMIANVASRQDCANITARYRERPVADWKLLRRPDLATSNRVRVYEVGPREQVEQVSTLARSANSLALAASIVGSAPSAGVGASLGAGYRRDVMNRAAALERVPEVVGYSLAGRGTFGWVIGPRATTDGRGRAELQQLLKPYDLSVDLSVPSWWANVDLELTTLWAPSPHDLAAGTLPQRRREGQGGRDTDDRVIKVTLPAVPADYRAFTQLMLADSRRELTINPIVGGPVNACAATTLLVTGKNIWRAQRVLLMGTALDRSAFAIAPDMDGIIVTVPAMPAIPGEMAYRRDDQLRVLTPLGPVSERIAYEASPSGDGCKSAKAADATAVTITGISLDDIVVPSLVSIDVAGTNLATVDEVKLASQPGSITQRGGDGKSMTVEFSEARTGSITAGRAKLEFFSKKKSVGTPQNVHVTRK